MIWWKKVILAFCGAGCGLINAGGFAAFITWLSIVPRLADITNTVRKVRFFERCLGMGFILFGVVAIFPFKLDVVNVFYAQLILIPFGLFAGIFSGCLAGALAEVLQTIPILSRSLKNREIIKYIIFAVALAKCGGSLIQLMK